MNEHYLVCGGYSTSDMDHEVLALFDNKKATINYLKKEFRFGSSDEMYPRCYLYKLVLNRARGFNAYLDVENFMETNGAEQ